VVVSSQLNLRLLWLFARRCLLRLDFVVILMRHLEAALIALSIFVFGLSTDSQVLALILTTLTTQATEMARLADSADNTKGCLTKLGLEVQQRQDDFQQASLKQATDNQSLMHELRKLKANCSTASTASFTPTDSSQRSPSVK
jgi:hypothetical protein